MDHAITIGDVVTGVLVSGGFIGVGALCYFLVWMFNPWRSGH